MRKTSIKTEVNTPVPTKVSPYRVQHLTICTSWYFQQSPLQLNTELTMAIFEYYRVTELYYILHYVASLLLTEFSHIHITHSDQYDTDNHCYSVQFGGVVHFKHTVLSVKSCYFVNSPYKSE